MTLVHQNFWGKCLRYLLYICVPFIQFRLFLFIEIFHIDQFSSSHSSFMLCLSSFVMDACIIVSQSVSM